MTLIQRHTKATPQIYRCNVQYEMLQIHIGAQKDKNTDSIGNEMLTYSRMKFIVLRLFVLYVVICTQ
jgi:hypothetical protein